MSTGVRSHGNLKNFGHDLLMLEEGWSSVPLDVNKENEDELDGLERGSLNSVVVGGMTWRPKAIVSVSKLGNNMRL